ncbi:MAG: FHA domain-containing protein [Muribaculaceae bacterium]|nr:FHA domain-containing protein [Muribaculaceae bacterium]
MPHTISIGRGATNDIIIDHQAVTRQHAVITFDDNGSIIYSDNSTNGTCINGKFIRGRSMHIKPGDEILLPGDIILSWSKINSRNPYSAGRRPYTETTVRDTVSNDNNGTDNTGYQPEPQPAPKRRNVCGLLSLIFSLVAIPFYCPPITIIGEGFSTVAFILGFIGVFFRPRGKAIAGMILSLIIPAIFITIFLAIIGTLDALY